MSPRTLYAHAAHTHTHTHTHRHGAEYALCGVGSLLVHYCVRPDAGIYTAVGAHGMVKKKSKQEFQGGKKIISHINTASVAQGEVKSMDKKRRVYKTIEPPSQLHFFVCVKVCAFSIIRLEKKIIVFLLLVCVCVCSHYHSLRPTSTCKSSGIR